MEASKFTFFWGNQSPFSNHHIKEFTVEDKKFICNEQYVMYSKAKLFQDEEIAEKILKETNPKKHRLLGSKVSGFEEQKWVDNREEIARRGALAKFRQNPDLLEALLSTGDTELAEASPNGSIWGIGMTKDNPLALDRSTWKGQNLLGQILTQIRNELREEMNKNSLK